MTVGITEIDRETGKSALENLNYLEKSYNDPTYRIQDLGLGLGITHLGFPDCV